MPDNKDFAPEVPAPVDGVVDDVYILFADNGNVRQWQRTPFDGSEKFTLGQLVMKAARPAPAGVTDDEDNLWHKDIPVAVSFVESKTIEEMEKAITACQDWDVAGLVHEGLVTDMATAYLEMRRAATSKKPCDKKGCKCDE